MIFKYLIQVTADNIDEMNHANNRAYLDWMIDAAVAHSHAVGYQFEKFVALGGAFVVRKHEMEYLRSAYLGENLVVETWISSYEGSRTVREYRILRAQDNKVLFLGKTTWVWIDLQTGKSTPIPDQVKRDYGDPQVRSE